MSKQVWFCEGCRNVGIIEIGDSEDLMSVVWNIEDSHSQMSPECGIPYQGLRVVDHSMVNNNNIALPDWVVRQLLYLE